MEELLAYVNPVTAIVPVSKSAAAIVPTAVNAIGFDRVCFLIQTGAMGTGAVLQCKVTESTSSTGTYADITSAAITNVTTTGASKVYAVDVKVNSAKPYLKLAGTAATAAILHSAVAIRYGGSRAMPGTLGTQEYVRD